MYHGVVTRDRCKTFRAVCGRAIKPVRYPLANELSKDKSFRSVTCDGPDETVATGRAEVVQAHPAYALRGLRTLAN